jgi:hypothetical protein
VYGDALKFEFFAELILDEAYVGEVEESFLIHKQYERGGLNRGLGGVEYFGENAFLRRRFVSIFDLFHKLVERIGRDTFFSRLSNLIDEVERFEYALTRGVGDSNKGDVAQVGHAVLDLVFELLKSLCLVFDKIPFGPHENHGGALVVDVSEDATILLGDVFGCVHHHETYVRSSDGTQ